MITQVVIQPRDKTLTNKKQENSLNYPVRKILVVNFSSYFSLFQAENLEIKFESDQSKEMSMSNLSISNNTKSNYLQAVSEMSQMFPSPTNKLKGVFKIT